MRVETGHKTATYTADEGYEVFDRKYRQMLVDDIDESVVREILNHKNEDDENGRSQTIAIRLPNGDLVLGFYPQGDTYENVTQFYGV